MEQCKICKTQLGNFACGHGCGSLYCSEQCANHDWKVKGHFLACGDYLDELPVEILYNVLLKLSPEDLMNAVTVNLKLQSIIDAKYFQQQYVRIHQNVSEWENTLEYLAIEKNNKYLTAWILVLSDDILQRFKRGVVLYLVRSACISGNVDILRRFKTFPGIETFDWHKYLTWAAQKGHANVIEFVVRDEQFNASARSNGAFIAAVLNNDLDIVKILAPFASQFDILRAIGQAGVEENTEMINYLLSTTDFSPSALKLLEYDMIELKKLKRFAVSNLIYDFLQRRRSREMGEESETKRTKIGQKMTQK